MSSPFLDELIHGMLLFARRVAFARGWQRFAISISAGLLAGLSQAPLYVVPAFIIGFALFVWVLDGLDETLTGYGQAFVSGWSFGAGYFLSAFHWLWWLDISSFDQLVSALGLISIAALAPALAALSAHLAWRVGPERVVILAIFWATAEWCRGHFFGGLPWGLSGYAWGNNLPVLQVTAWIGIYGLSFLTLLFALVFVAAIPNPSMNDGRRHVRAGRNRIFAWPVYGLALLVLTYAVGQARLSATPAERADPVYLRISHGGEERCDVSRRGSANEAVRDGHEVPAESLRMLIIPGRDCWSKFLSADRTALDDLGASLQNNQLAFVQSARDVSVIETLHIVDSQGRIRATHDQWRNFPFIGGGGGQRNAQRTSPRTFAPGIVPELGVMVGAEAAYSGAVVDETKRPAWLLHLSDEPWLKTAGARQLLDHARVRAVEEGVPVIHAAYGGYSAVIDPFGRLQTEAAPGTSTAVDMPLPGYLPPTLFGRFGDLGFLLLLLGAGLGVFVWARAGPITLRSS